VNTSIADAITPPAEEPDIDLENPPEFIPKPSGYKLLIAIPKPVKKIGSLYIPEDHADKLSMASVVALVVSIGPGAFRDGKKFPNHDRRWWQFWKPSWQARCGVGDWVIVRTYSGTRFGIGGQEFRVINDDQIECVADDPTMIRRIA